MAVYLGDEKIKIILSGTKYYFRLYSSNPITNGIRLVSSDNYTLKDLNGLYLTLKEDK